MNGWYLPNKSQSLNFNLPTRGTDANFVISIRQYRVEIENYNNL